MLAPDDVGDLEGILAHLWPPPYRIVASARPQLSPAQFTFALFPHPGRTTVLIPVRPRRVAAGAVRGYKSPTTWRDRTRTRATAWTASSGAARLFPWTVQISGPPEAPSLLNHVRGHLALQQVYTAVALGPPRANRKPVLQFLTYDGTQVAFAKVGVNDLTSARVRAESLALDRLRSLNLGRLTVPERVDIPAWGDTPFLVTRPVPTWTTGGIDPSARGRALRSLVEASELTQVVLGASPWWKGLSVRLAELGSTPESRVLRDARDQIESRSEDITLAHGQAHGDWSPWNIAADGPKVVAWDWERFSTCVPVGLDALHYGVQEQIRLGARSPREALTTLWGRSHAVVTENGANPMAGPLLFALYLLSLGERHLTDGQQAAGSERGPLGDWLIPVLQLAVTQLNREAP